MTHAALPYTFNQFYGTTELPLPCDVDAGLPKTGRKYPLTIRRASLKEAPSTLRHIRKQPAYDIGHGVLIEPDNISLYVSYSGDEIIVDCPDTLQAYAAGWVIHAGAALSTLFTRGVPLHCAGASHGGKYFGLLASAGTGKSTTLWALLQSGALFANDDLISVFLDDETPLAYPSVSLYPKLHQIALEREGLDSTQYQVAPPNEDKFWVPISRKARIIEPQSLSALFVLDPSRVDTDGVSVTRNSIESASLIIRQHLHGLWLVHKYVPGDRLIALCQKLAQSVPVYTLRYTKTFANLPLLVEAIQTAL